MNELYICRTKYSDNNENIKKIFEIIKNGDNVSDRRNHWWLQLFIS